MSHNRRWGALSRNVQAFESLLRPEDDEDIGSSRKQKQKGKTKGTGGKGRPIILRDEVRSQHTEQGRGSDLQQLRALFSDTLPEEIINDVYAACGTSLEAATEALLGMSVTTTSTPTLPNCGQPEIVFTSSGGAPAPPCYWDWLPQQCKEIVLGKLSVRDMARTAGVCAELAQHVRQQRQRASTVRLPPGISKHAVRGAVAAFSTAPSVSLARWAAHLRFPNQFEDVFMAICLGEQDRPSGVPVTHLDLSRCSGLTDADVAVLCGTLRHLESLDLSRCTQLTDDCLGALSRYNPLPSGFADSDSDSDPGLSSSGLAVHAGAELTGNLAQLALQHAPAQAPHAVSAACAGSTESGALTKTPLESPSAAVGRIAAARDTACQQASRLPEVPSAAGLRRLRLRETGVSSRGLKPLLQGPGAAYKSLQHVDISGCRAIGPEGFTCGPLSAMCTLRASACLQLRSVVLQLPVDAPLQELELSGCRQLREVVVAAPHLQRMSVSQCGVLSTLLLRCRSLQELRCVNCTRLQGLGPEFECPELRHLDLFGCRALDSQGLGAAVENFSRLASINLAGCNSLSQLLLPDQAPQLDSISISGCSVLRQVVLGSKLIQSLTAKACTRLMDVRIYSEDLRVLDFENCSNLRNVTLPTQLKKKETSQLVLKGCLALPAAIKAQLKASFA